MEDGVTEVQSLLPPLDLNPEDGYKREDDKAKEDGFVSIGKVEKMKEEDLGVAKDEAKDSGGGGGGGLINNLISTLVTPLSPRTGKATEHESVNAAADGVEHRERGGLDNGGEGGLINNLVSNFFHQSEGDGVVENEKDKEEEKVSVEKIKRVKTDNGANGGGGGIIHNIVSHLPASLPDDAVPTADEATFLINSLVRD